jgi:hypothetical protein
LQRRNGFRLVDHHFLAIRFIQDSGTPVHPDQIELTGLAVAAGYVTDPVLSDFILIKTVLRRILAVLVQSQFLQDLEKLAAVLRIP